MKNTVLSIMLVFCLSYTLLGQKASDVIENGIPVKSGEKIFFNFDSKVLKYDVARSLNDNCNPIDFTTLSDSSIFLVAKNGVNLYLSPLNPLNYSFTTENKVIIDPINEEAIAVLGTIIDIMKSVNSKPGASGKREGLFVNPTSRSKLDSIQSNLMTIRKLLEDNKKSEISGLFKKLKNIPFLDEKSTIQSLKDIKESIMPIEKLFNETDSLIKVTKSDIDKCNITTPNNFIISYVFKKTIDELIIIREEQKKRIKNLQIAYDLVEKAQRTASIGGGATGLEWCIKLDEVQCTEGKISIYSLTINESGYNLSDKDEIIISEPKSILNRTIRVRKFQRFIPEVSIGTAFTFFKYNIYGTSSDSTGQQFVNSTSESSISNLNFTAMINFNYYLPNSPIHPLWQIGIGVNPEIPTILTGIGIRSNINGIRRLAISLGIAITWTKELTSLEVGDKISGTNDIDADLKYQITWPPKAYIGIQYNF